MKDIKHIAIIVIASLFGLFGCNSEKRCQKKLAKIEAKCPGLFQIHDTTIYKKKDSIVYYHDIITTPEETHTDTFTIPCPDHNSVTKHFKGGSATVSISKGQIIVQCHEDSLKTIITHKDSIIFSQATIIKTGMATRTITTNVLTGFQTFCYWLVILALCVGGLYFGGKYVLPLAIKAIKPKL